MLRFIAMRLGVLIPLLDMIVTSELLNHLDEKELSSVAFRLQDEKEKRLLLQNDVDIMMLKIGQLERRKQELKIIKEPECPSNWMRHTNSCYIFSEQSATWFEAELSCRAEGGHLAEIETLTEYEYLNSTAKTQGGSLWIGATDAFKEGVWVWIKSMKVCHFTRWNRDQPDNAGGLEHCAVINSGEEGNWNDGPCSIKKNFICEKELTA